MAETLVTRTCHQCGKTFSVRAALLRFQEPKYCSRACLYVARRTSEERSCQNCGKSFRVQKNEKKKRDGSRGGLQYCSKKCLIAGRESANSVPCASCGRVFRTRKSQPARYCSWECSQRGLGRQPSQLRECEHCGQGFKAWHTELAKGRGRFCSPACYHAASRKPAIFSACAQCGKLYQVTDNKKSRRFCSRSCCGASQRTRTERTCETCGKVFKPKPALVARGRGRFCSQPCRGLAQRRRVTRTCERCSCIFTVEPNRKGQRFCCRSCYIGPSGASREIECLTCGKIVKVKASALDKGNGKYCSRKCYWSAVWKRRVRLRCKRCQRIFAVRPSAQHRRYCSQKCYRDSPYKTCLNCRQPFKPGRRDRSFCSLACAYVGKQPRRRAQGSEDRDRRILELHALGHSSQAIASTLREEKAEWGYPPETIRVILHRAQGRQRRTAR
jgi:hypothetical protein